MKTTAPKYDVAISFLYQDEPTAKALYQSLSTSLKVFFFPRNQEELAGTDGMELMRRPFMEDCRVSVVVYRSSWAKTPWTRVEETAIKEACLSSGWHRLFFLCLDDDGPFPIWLPQTHVRFSLKNYSLQEAVGAIKARVQECGGQITRDDALARARVVHAENLHLKRKEELFASQAWITGTAHPAIATLLHTVVELSHKISSEAGFKILTRSNGSSQCVLTDDRVSVVASWQQAYTNVMGHFEVQEFSEKVILPGESKFYFAGHPPSPIEVLEFQPDLSITEELCWRDKITPNEILSSSDLANKVLNTFITLTQRANRGEIDTSSEFFRRINQARAETEYDPFHDE